MAYEVLSMCNGRLWFGDAICIKFELYQLTYMLIQIRAVRLDLSKVEGNFFLFSVKS